MRPLGLSWLCHNSYGEYATRAVNDYIINVQNGDEDFDDMFFDTFFQAVTKDTSLLENGEFSALFGEILAHALEVLIDTDDFEGSGKYPIGVSQYDANRLMRKIIDSGHHDVLTELEEQLSFYENEYDWWYEWERESDDDFGMDDGDFLDYTTANLIL